MANTPDRTCLIIDRADATSAYLAYQREDFDAIVERWASSGGVWTLQQTVVVWTEEQIVANSGVNLDPGGFEPSIGMDDEGHIWFAGLARDGQLMFARTSLPRNIGTWVDWRTRPGTPGPGGLRNHPTYGVRYHQSYPGFAYMHGKLYLRMRMLVEDSSTYSGSTPGDYGWYLGRWNSATQAWTPLGGTNYSHGTPCLVWHPTGAQNSAYQRGVLAVCPGRSAGVIHIAWTSYKNVDVVGTPSEIHYAYSPDHGVSWFDASDTLLGNSVSTLPILIGDTGTLAREDNSVPFNETVCVAERPDGRPVIGFTWPSGSVTRRRYWTGAAWEDHPNDERGEAPGRIFIASDGTMIVPDTTGFHHSDDEANEWVGNWAFEPGTSEEMLTLWSMSPDIGYFWLTDELPWATHRLTGNGGVDNKITVSLLDLGITPPDDDEPVVAAATTGTAGRLPSLPGVLF